MYARRFFWLLFLILFGNYGTIYAQGTDYLQNIGKIYVVVAVITTLFVGVVIFLISLDRRLKRIEKSLNKK